MGSDQENRFLARLIKPKPVRAALITILLAAVVSGLVYCNQAWRTRSYFAFERTWSSHWPLTRGKLAPKRIRSLFEPFVPVRIQLEPGVNMLLDPYDLVSRIILETGQWEADSWEAIKQHLPAGGTFIDVGAHIGYYSLRAAKRVGTSGRVIAIEPNPETLRNLRDNVEASHATVVSVYPVACSEAETEIDLFAAARANTGMSSFSLDTATRSGDGIRRHRVRARPLDGIVAEAGLSRVDVVKIDVEGAELLVLRGARQTLLRYRPVLIVEVIETQLRSMDASPAELKEFLRSLGYLPHRQMGLNVLFSR